MQPNAPVPYGPAPMTPNNPYGPTQLPKPPRSGSPLLVVGLILSVSLLFFVSAFAVWAYLSREDYKNNVDQKIAAANEVAVKQEDAKKDAEFAEKEKSPTKSYTGPSTYGGIKISYPKTWSAYVTENVGKSGTPVDGYFHPGFVPGLQSGTDFALRLSVSSQSYTSLLQPYEALLKSGKVKVTAYTAPKVPSVTGSRIEGQIAPGQQGVVVLLPLRDKAIKISTESLQYLNDFDGIVLSSLTFEP